MECCVSFLFQFNNLSNIWKKENKKDFVISEYFDTSCVAEIQLRDLQYLNDCWIPRFLMQLNVFYVVEGKLWSDTMACTPDKTFSTISPTMSPSCISAVSNSIDQQLRKRKVDEYVMSLSSISDSDISNVT